MRKELKDIEVGDRVWVGTYNFPRSVIQVVARLTPAQIILDGRYSEGAKSQYNRYQRGKLSRAGSYRSYNQIHGGFSGDQITAVATEDECAKWDAKQERQRAEREATQAEKDRREAKRQKLESLFGDNVNVSRTHNNKTVEWEVVIYLRSEKEVRRLAELIGSERA